VTLTGLVMARQASLEGVLQHREGDPAAHAHLGGRGLEHGEGAAGVAIRLLRQPRQHLVVDRELHGAEPQLTIIPRAHQQELDVLGRQRVSTITRARDSRAA